ncbi:FIST signal transduction protein [Spirulina sp. 06S082]|uniref:FIST signal transduction protein n=1 Tax=Spirulina sp. 06S082 TaxID=3110248 RepID=UPI002B1F9338|nr:FIST N-terminal domain-containing protein [Spirulina sp. 06S082]MEA5468858.1 FIST N-terminal domain-containing protein [Spirulina sp. 06S082]
MSAQIKWVNALSTLPSLEAAIAEVVTTVQQSLSTTPDLGIVFISSAYASEYPRLVPLLLEHFPFQVLIGCGGGGVVGIGDRGESLEIEANPALSLSVASLPGVKMYPFQITQKTLPDLDSSPSHWCELMGVDPQENPSFILLADPFSAQITDLLQGLDFAYPSSVKVGGLASNGAMGGQSGLFYHASGHSGPSLYREGTVGVALSGDITVKTIVAQGCRPIGQTYQVTQGQRNVILQIAEFGQTTTEGESQPTLVALRNLLQTLDESDRVLAQNSLFVGLARDEFKTDLHQGDFLIRNLIGVDPNVGAVAIGDRVRPGQRLRFHLRDARTSEDDLNVLLGRYQLEQQSGRSAVGALMFSCLGRGEGLYGKPHFDSRLFQRYLGDIPIGGFFCNGEIGPVAGGTFLHGYTSVFAIFY